MTHTRTVILYGNSLAVSSIGASLRERVGLRVLPVDAALTDAARQLCELHPDIILFDLATARPDFAIALWKAQPGLLLIGVDLLIGKALVFSSQPSRALTTDDLLQLIEAGMNLPKEGVI